MKSTDSDGSSLPHHQHHLAVLSSSSGSSGSNASTGSGSSSRSRHSQPHITIKPFKSSIRAKYTFSPTSLHSVYPTLATLNAAAANQHELAANTSAQLSSSPKKSPPNPVVLTNSLIFIEEHQAQQQAAALKNTKRKVTREKANSDAASLREKTTKVKNVAESAANGAPSNNASRDKPTKERHAFKSKSALPDYLNQSRSKLDHAQSYNKHEHAQMYKHDLLDTKSSRGKHLQLVRPGSFRDITRLDTNLYADGWNIEPTSRPRFTSLPTVPQGLTTATAAIPVEVSGYRRAAGAAASYLLDQQQASNSCPTRDDKADLYRQTSQHRKLGRSLPHEIQRRVHFRDDLSGSSGSLSVSSSSSRETSSVDSNATNKSRNSMTGTSIAAAAHRTRSSSLSKPATAPKLGRSSSRSISTSESSPLSTATGIIGLRAKEPISRSNAVSMPLRSSSTRLPSTSGSPRNPRSKSKYGQSEKMFLVDLDWTETESVSESEIEEPLMDGPNTWDKDFSDGAANYSYAYSDMVSPAEIILAETENIYEEILSPNSSPPPLQTTTTSTTAPSLRPASSFSSLSSSSSEENVLQTRSMQGTSSNPPDKKSNLSDPFRSMGDQFRSIGDKFRSADHPFRLEDEAQRRNSPNEADHHQRVTSNETASSRLQKKSSSIKAKMKRMTSSSVDDPTSSSSHNSTLSSLAGDDASPKSEDKSRIEAKAEVKKTADEAANGGACSETEQEMTDSLSRMKLFRSLSKGRRKYLEAYSRTDWDWNLPDNVDVYTVIASNINQAATDNNNSQTVKNNNPSSNSVQTNNQKNVVSHAKPKVKLSKSLPSIQSDDGGNEKNNPLHSNQPNIRSKPSFSIHSSNSMKQQQQPQQLQQLPPAVQSSSGHGPGRPSSALPSLPTTPNSKPKQQHQSAAVYGGSHVHHHPTGGAGGGGHPMQFTTSKHLAFSHQKSQSLGSNLQNLKYAQVKPSLTGLDSDAALQQKSMFACFNAVKKNVNSFFKSYSSSKLFK